MPRRPARPNGGRMPAAGAVALAAVLAGVIGASPGHAQPAEGSAQATDAGSAASPADLERAKARYKAAEAAMQAGRYDDAVRDYSAAYALSRDPALWFKLGHAHEKAGACAVALGDFARYLREGQPTPQFAATTNEHIAACGGQARDSAAETSASGGATGSAAPATPGNRAAGAGETSASTGSGSAASAIPALSGQAKVGWLLSGSALALVALGGVLAYAAGSSENDVRDLYVGFGNQVAAFDPQTRKRYDDLVDQGRRYQHLSWAAFGIAGAAAAGAALLFTLGDRGPAALPDRVAPIVTTHTAGVAVRF